MQYVGKINKEILENEFNDLQTSDVVLTNERIQHIKERHIADYDLFCSHIKTIIENPDIVLKDAKHANTIFMIKHIEESNINIVIKLAVLGDAKHPKNSIMTAYRIREKNVNKLIKHNKLLYKSE